MCFLFERRNGRPSVVLGLLFAVGLYAPLLANAGPGHDHGDEAPPGGVAAGETLPRFVAESETFEAVGVIHGRELTLYLDDAGTNAPVEHAEVTLQIGQMRVDVEGHGHDGHTEFEAVLPESPAPGVMPVSLTVTADGRTENLTGELDIHADEDPDSAVTSGQGRRLLSWGLAALLMLMAAVAVVRMRRSRVPENGQGGGAV